MKRTSLIGVLLLMATLVTVIYVYPVKADSDEPIQFLDSGITVYSPVNMTYYGNGLVLNLTLYGAGQLGTVDRQISMNYSIDGAYNGTVSLRSNGEIHVVTTAIGTFALQNLPDGSHVLAIYLYGVNQRSTNPWYLFYTNKVYFSTTGDPSSPTPKPSSNLSVSINSSPNTVYVGQQVLFFPDVRGGTGSFVNYQWYANGSKIVGATIDGCIFSSNETGQTSIYVVVQDAADPNETATSNTITITVDAPTPSPTPYVPANAPIPSPKYNPAVPELSWLLVVPLLLSAFSVAVIVRHRKTANLKQ